MRPKTELEPLDDPAFLRIVDTLTVDLLETVEPEDFYLIRVDNWFDHKWLNFSGKGRVHFDGSPWRDVALDELSQEKLTFPPFTPKRIVTEHYFARTTKGYFQEQASTQRVHQWILQHSSYNLHRRVTHFSRCGLFLWFASLSAKNGKASIMVYSVKAESVSSWFASFVRDSSWKLHRVKGTSREWIQELISQNP